MSSPIIQTTGSFPTRFPDIEADVIAFLSDRVSVDVVLKVPAPRPQSFVRVWRTGGAAANRVLDLPLITVEGWAPDDEDASALVGACREALLRESNEMPLVRNVTEVTGPYFIPDPESETPRYRFTVQLRVRARR